MTIRNTAIRKNFLALVAAFVVAAACVCTASLSAAAPADGEARWKFMDFYQYDKNMPFNVEKSVAQENDKFIVYRIVYDSIHDKRVTAWLMIPKNISAPVPAVLFLHGYTGRKEDAGEALDKCAAAGFAMMSLDAEYHGERKIAGKEMYSKLAYSSRDGMIQTVVDFRRAIDLLETYKEIDPNRIGFAGGSMGGIVGAVVTSVEPRIRASVLVVGGADWAYMLRSSVVGQALGLTNGEHALNPKVFGKIVAPADPINYAQLISPRPVLMLNAKHDMLVPPQANKFLFARLKNPRKIVWFNEGHGLPFDTAVELMIQFFNDYLKGDKDTSGLNAVVEGYKTEPLSMKLDRPLPEPLTDMPRAELFNYDSFLPLNETREPAPALPGVFIVKFQSTHDKYVAGKLFVSAAGAKQPFPAVILVDEPNVNYDDNEKTIASYLEKGNAVLEIESQFCSIYGTPDKYVEQSDMDRFQTGQDIRRAIDFLASQPETKGTSESVVVVTRGVENSKIASDTAAVDKRIADLVHLKGKDVCKR